METNEWVDCVDYLPSDILDQDMTKVSYQVVLEGECVVRDALFKDTAFCSLTGTPFKKVKCWRVSNSCREEAERLEHLKQYEKWFGQIIFPDEQLEIRRIIQANPGGEYLYSYDGLKWAVLPMDTGKIAFSQALLRQIPEGVIVGITKEVKRDPFLYAYSDDNGHEWHPLRDEPSYHWIYHGRYENKWFHKIR